jgi:DNA-binding IclR family transcriptional regulator
MVNPNNGNLVPAVDRATDILDYLAKNSKGTIKEIATDLHIPIASATRIIKTLTAKNYLIEHHMTPSSYSLGLKLLMFSQAVYREIDLDSIAKNEMKKLAEETDLVSQLAIYEQGYVMYTQMALPSPTVNVIIAPLRTPLNINTSAGGKAIISQMPDGQMDQVLQNANLKRATRNSITDKDLFKKHLLQCRMQGYATDDEEYSENIGCIAAPIRDHEGVTIAAVGVTGPINIIKEHNAFERIKDLTIETADCISHKLGYVTSK